MNKMELILSSDFIISFGTFIEDKQLSDSISKAVENNGAKFVYMHPIDNTKLKPFYSQLIKYEVGSEEGICALLLNSFTLNAPYCQLIVNNCSSIFVIIQSKLNVSVKQIFVIFLLKLKNKLY